MLKICVLIPTYNNAGTILDVINRSYIQVTDIIVVNDGSTDNTPKLLAEWNVTVVTFPKNKGKGAALKAGFAKAREMGFTHVITLDADGQHYPEDIPILISEAQKNPKSIIIGSRPLDAENMPSGNTFANKFSNFWFTLQTGLKLPDTQTGYRVYPLDYIKGEKILTSRYESELELLVCSAWAGVELKPVTIKVFYPENRVSHFRPLLDFTRISILNTILCLGAILYGYPLKFLRLFRRILYSLYAILFLSILMFFIIYPAVFCCFVLTKPTEAKRQKLHYWIWKLSRFVIYRIPGTKFTYKNEHNESFEKPSIIICNHQSHLDLMAVLMLSPRLVVLTKNWVQKNPFYGFMIHYAEFYSIEDGMDMDLMQNLIDRGYSIVIFPEGTRSENSEILRFHRGAFYLAESLKLDIIPLFIHGLGKVLPKKEFLLNKGDILLEVGKRISPEDKSFGEDYRQRAKSIRQYYKSHFNFYYL